MAGRQHHVGRDQHTRSHRPAGDLDPRDSAHHVVQNLDEVDRVDQAGGRPGDGLQTRLREDVLRGGRGLICGVGTHLGPGPSGLLSRHGCE